MSLSVGDKLGLRNPDVEDLVDRSAQAGGRQAGGRKGLRSSRHWMCPRPADIVALDDALHELARMAPRKARIAELRFFGGLGVKDAAAVVVVSSDTGVRDWIWPKLGF
jgi:RNA polymerase sigma-70 factor (ECF subfamily)